MVGGGVCGEDFFVSLFSSSFFSLWILFHCMGKLFILEEMKTPQNVFWQEQVATELLL